ncbi:hypothetical protein IV203_034887 [Nitzschia inconspicua]|uniref:Uncharacterized protein n=1 Tax=Nitzschia inconspicua TaxID=303405 RepID=A0A9K3PWL3_9STRA|nr:hypothetical protein IV203_034887 [Nitzschia inconspicua]
MSSLNPFFGDGDNRDSDWEDFEEEAALLNESGGVSQPKDGTSRLCIQGLGQSSSNVGVKNASIKVFTAWRKYRGKLADVSWMEIYGDNLMGYMNEAFCFARESTEGNEQERQESGGALLAGIRRRGSGQRRRDTWDLGHLPCFGILVLSGRWTPPEHGGNTRRDAKCCFSIIAQNRESSTAKLLTQAIQKCLPEDIKSRITSRSLRDTGITELASHGSLSIDDGGARFGHSTGTTQDHYISDQHYLYGLKAGMARAGAVLIDCGHDNAIIQHLNKAALHSRLNDPRSPGLLQFKYFKEGQTMWSDSYFNAVPAETTKLDMSSASFKDLLYDLKDILDLEDLGKTPITKATVTENWALTNCLELLQTAVTQSTEAKEAKEELKELKHGTVRGDCLRLAAKLERRALDMLFVLRGDDPTIEWTKKGKKPTGKFRSLGGQVHPYKRAAQKAWP